MMPELYAIGCEGRTRAALLQAMLFNDVRTLLDIRHPTCAALADALRRLRTAGIPHPDDNGVELYWNRPQKEWPRTADGKLTMYTRRLDLDGLLREQ